MNSSQSSITAAYAVILGVALVADNWYDNAKKVLSKVVSKSSAPAQKSSGVNRFEAFVGSYVIFYILAESEEIGPVAAAFAWAFAIGIFIVQFGAVEQKFPEIFHPSAASAPSTTSSSVVAASNNTQNEFGATANGQNPV